MTDKSRPAESIERVLKLIESRLQSSLQLEELAAEACYSKFHLIRIFQELMGETVMDYVRKRRISEAGTALIKTNEPILDIALAYQFDSQEAFTRSFQQVFGMPPGKFRKIGHRHVTFDRYTLSQKDLETLANFKPMEPKIVKIETKQLIGQHTTTQLADNQIPKLWRSFMPRRREVKNQVDELVYAIHRYEPGLKMEDFTPHTVYDTWACVEVSEAQEVPEGMVSRELAGGLYAVFLYKGPAAQFGATFNYIHAEWLPQSGYTLDNRDQFEVIGPNYLGPAHPDSEEEVWIPIRESGDL